MNDQITQWFAEANRLYQIGKLAESLIYINKILAVSPDMADGWFNKANLLNRMGCYREAIAAYTKLAAINPDYVALYNNRSVAFKNMGNDIAALEDLEEAVARNPWYADAWNNRAVILDRMGRCEEALASCDRAIALKPDFAEGYNNKGNSFRQLARHPEAKTCYDHAIALKPDYAEAFHNRASVLQSMKQYHDALSDSARAITLKPDYAEAMASLGLLKLLLGDYQEGWKLYEWRWRIPAFTPLAFTRPLWLGKENIRGKTLLLHAEQGLGDTIQFCRYALLAEAQGASVVLQVQKPLARLVTTLSPAIKVITPGSDLPEYDFHCPLMSLPLAFGTTLDTIPVPVPYLSVNPEHQQVWQERLGKKQRPRIGLVWSGSPDHKNDHNRSQPLEHLLPLLRHDAEFHSLQKDIRKTDEIWLNNSRITDHRHYLQDFNDTAALVGEMDLVISVDTSVAHLAGGLGKPLWLMLPFAPDFRWLDNRSDSLWYNNCRIFRQPSTGEWEYVINRINEELAGYLSSCCLL